MATKKPMKFKRYDIGGEVDESTAKQRGLDISNKEEPVGFFERIRMGNIDEPGSEAYNRFGAGRGRASAPAPAAPAAPAASSRLLSDDMYSDTGSSTGMGAAGTGETVKPTRQVMTKPTLPASKPTATPAAPVPRLRDTGPTRGDLINKPTQYAGPMRGMRSDAGGLPVGSNSRREEGKSAADKMDTKGMKDKAQAALADDPTALMGTGAAAAAALLGRTKLGKLGKLFKGSKTSSSRDLVTAPSSKGPSYMGKADDEKAAKAREKLMKSSFIKKGGDDVTDVTAKKRGGMVKKYASGGMVSSASKRADGIASKGKTRCKIC